MKGYVYILSNESMPGIVKIGRSKNGGHFRAEELSKATGVPTPFQLVYQMLVEDCIAVERAVHSALKPHRKGAKEFFAVTPKKAIGVITERQHERTPTVEAKSNHLKRLVYDETKIVELRRTISLLESENSHLRTLVDFDDPSIEKIKASFHGFELDSVNVAILHHMCFSYLTGIYGKCDEDSSFSYLPAQTICECVSDTLTEESLFVSLGILFAGGLLFMTSDSRGNTIFKMEQRAIRWMERSIPKITLDNFGGPAE